ncbi:MAG: zf-HC2 domain-containing protein [Nocardioidaceae bacterium]
MTTQHIWHADEALLRAYVDGRAGPVSAASVEAHLLECAACRASFGPLMAAEPLARAWDGIRAAVEAPRGTALARLLGRLGMSEESIRLLIAVPAFRGAWLLGMLVVTLLAGVAALFSGERGLAMFLLVAPLAPVAGVAASFGGDADPAHELVTVTPHSAFHLLLLRTAGVLVTSIPATVFIGLALPGPAWLGVAWLTPAIAGVLVTLALAPSIGSTPAAATFCAFWTVAVALSARVHNPLEVVEPAMQLALGALALVAAATVIIRYQSYDHLGRQS